MSFLFNLFTDYDPQTIEQKEQAQPACLPLSYVLRFMTEAARLQNQTKQQTLPTQTQSPTSPTEPVTPTSKGSTTGTTGNSNNNNNNTSSTGTEIKRKLAIKHHSYSLSSSNRSNTPTGLYRK